MIVGLHGYAQSGKDALAKVLIEEFGFRRVAFADTLREAVYRLNPIVEHSDETGPVRVQEIVNRAGWEEAKVLYPEVRRLLQVIGTEVGRELIHEDIWVSIAMSKIKNNEDIVITDVRYLNEVQAIQDAYGILVKINRPGVGPVNDHVSDAGLPDDMFNFILNNNGSIEEWQQKARAVFSEFQKASLFEDAPPRYGDFEFPDAEQML